MTRKNPQMLDSLYSIIGFKPCNEIEFPPALAPRKLTNPDAPKNDHYIQVSIGEKKVCAVPILYSKTTKYDMKAGGEFFAYLKFQLLLVEKTADGGKFSAVYNGQNPLLAEPADVQGFIEQVGKNTGYIIHPEEILADNFMMLVLEIKNLPSPEIIEKLRNVLSQKKPTAGQNKPAD
jgi:hypothetical protein